MIISSIINLKGGVGKTTTAINMAAELAARGKRVLLVDADQQHNLSDFYRAGSGKGLVEILGGEAGEEAIFRTAVPGIDLIPAAVELVMFDIARATGDEKMIYRVRDFLRGQSYDVCLIDCPPGFSAASVAALVASDEAIVPVKVDAFALAGLREIRAQVTSLRKLNAYIDVRGLITMYTKNDLVSHQGANMLRDQKDLPFFTQIIRTTRAAARSTFQRKPLREVSRSSAGAVDYRELVTEWLELHESEMGGQDNG